MTGDRHRYRFGPLERRGLVAGWRGGQIAAVAGGLVVAVLVLRARPSLASIVVAAVALGGAVALACWPIGGMTGEEWLPTVVGWLTGGHRHRSRAPGFGHRAGPGGILEAPLELGEPLGGLTVLHVPVGGVGECGVIHDRVSRTFTAVMTVRGHSFALLGPEEKERRVGSWANVLAALARERSVVRRVQWVASSLPDDGLAVRGYLSERAALEAGGPARSSYESLLDGASTSRHEVMLAVQVACGGQSARAVRAAGGGTAGACAVLLREVANLRRLLGEAEVLVDELLTAREVAAVVRAATSAGCRRYVGGVPAPMAVDEHWDSLRTDAMWHATYWISEWPRVDVGPDFLAPLLLGPVRRSVGVVMEPLSPSQAVRQVERARTADLADSELRRRGGFLATARRSREESQVLEREEELADGHASFRFSGYVTVSAPDKETLAAVCEATEQAGGQCRLELRRLYGEQERAFACTLPLCRGLS